MFVKLISIAILIAICIVSLGAGLNLLLSNESGQSLNVSDFGAFQWLAIVELLGLTATLIIAAWKIQVHRSKQIIFSFFFYSWRNSIHSSYAKFETIFKPEKLCVFPGFLFYTNIRNEPRISGFNNVD